MSSESESNVPEQARQLMKSRKYADAVRMLTTFLAENPRDRDGRELLGKCCFLTKKFDDAKAAFAQLTKDHAPYGAGWVNLGAVQNVLGDHMGASKSLRKAIQKDRKCAAAYYNLGIAQKALKMNSMAITAYRDAMKLVPEMPEPYANLANIYIEMKNLIQAVKCAEDGLKHCPNHPKLTAILKKARDLKDGIKSSEAPLGRLVDETELRSRTVQTQRRELDGVTRNQERDELRGIVRGLRKQLKPVPVMIEEGLQRQLHFLNLAAAQNDPKVEAPTAFEQMTETLAELDRISSETAAAVGEVRRHFDQTDPGLIPD
ncbi:MAG: tetratricopeptide repeat protein [Planctomycetaceae bacterium]|nr:tetratricopeptide repeat protein [Planctomycetaceae bacterium]